MLLFTKSDGYKTVQRLKWTVERNETGNGENPHRTQINFLDFHKLVLYKLMWLKILMRCECAGTFQNRVVMCVCVGTTVLRYRRFFPPFNIIKINYFSNVVRALCGMQTCAEKRSKIHEIKGKSGIRWFSFFFVLLGIVWSGREKKTTTAMWREQREASERLFGWVKCKMKFLFAPYARFEASLAMQEHH